MRARMARTFTATTVASWCILVTVFAFTDRLHNDLEALQVLPLALLLGMCGAIIANVTE